MIEIILIHMLREPNVVLHQLICVIIAMRLVFAYLRMWRTFCTLSSILYQKGLDWIFPTNQINDITFSRHITFGCWKFKWTSLIKHISNKTEYMGKGGAGLLKRTLDSEIIKTLQTLFVYLTSIFRYTQSCKSLFIVSALSPVGTIQGKLICRRG